MSEKMHIDKDECPLWVNSSYSRKSALYQKRTLGLEKIVDSEIFHFIIIGSGGFRTNET